MPVNPDLALLNLEIDQWLKAYHIIITHILLAAER